MRDFLEEIVGWKIEEVRRLKMAVAAETLYALVKKNLGVRKTSMKKAILESKTGVIPEFRRHDPSKGWIDERLDVGQVSLSCQRDGAAAMSILTDEKYYGGNDEMVCMARRKGVTIPILYRNIIVDEYQLYQAKLCGASAVNLIAAIMTKTECRILMSKAHEIGLEVLLELHTPEECPYCELKPDMYGISNRDFHTFETDIQTSFVLAEMMPKGVCLVSEGGISDAECVMKLRDYGYSGFIG